MLWPRVSKLGKEVGHDQLITLFGFGVTIKVKVIERFNVKMVSSQQLVKVL